MKKNVIFSYLNLALGVILLFLATFILAENSCKVEQQFESVTQDEVYSNSDLSSVIWFESKTETQNVLVYSFKRAPNFHFSIINSLTGTVVKTKRLSYNYSNHIIPSLGITQIIFPFHSFS